MVVERWDIMKTIITEIFDCVFELPDGFFEQPHIQQYLERQDALMEELLTVLPENKKYLIQEYEVAVHGSMEAEVLEAFRQGIKIGFLLKKEIHEE